MSMSDLKVKFGDCARSGVSPMNEDRRDAAMEVMLTIETVKDRAEARDFARPERSDNPVNLTFIIQSGLWTA